jgi:alpha-L-rhamnosidase
VYGEIKVNWEIQEEENNLLRVSVPANTLAVISLKNVSPDYLSELVKQVKEIGYSDPQYLEEEKRFEFTVGSGQIELKWKLHEVFQKIEK